MEDARLSSVLYICKYFVGIKDEGVPDKGSEDEQVWTTGFITRKLRAMGLRTGRFEDRGEDGWGEGGSGGVPGAWRGGFEDGEGE